MNAEPSDTDDEHPSCEERVEPAWQSRRADLLAILNAGEDAPAEHLGDYGLAFDYVRSDTFEDQDAGFWRYQFSTGGPQSELRFYVDEGGEVERAAFWFLDWFDGASVNVSGDEVAERVLERFRDMGVLDPAEARDQELGVHQGGR